MPTWAPCLELLPGYRPIPGTQKSMSELHKGEASEKGSCLVQVTQVVNKGALADLGFQISICSPAALPWYTVNAAAAAATADDLVPRGSGSLRRAHSVSELKVGGLQSSTCSSGLFVCGITLLIPELRRTEFKANLGSIGLHKILFHTRTPKQCGFSLKLKEPGGSAELSCSVSEGWHCLHPIPPFSPLSLKPLPCTQTRPAVEMLMRRLQMDRGWPVSVRFAWITEIF